MQTLDMQHNTSAAELERQILREIDGSSPNPKLPLNKEDQFRSLRKYLANDQTPQDVEGRHPKLMNDSDIAELWNGASGKPSEMKGPLQTG
jgi:hypothetical protein